MKKEAFNVSENVFIFILKWHISIYAIFILITENE